MSDLLFCLVRFIFTGCRPTIDYSLWHPLCLIQHSVVTAYLVVVLCTNKGGRGKWENRGTKPGNDITCVSKSKIYPEMCLGISTVWKSTSLTSTSLLLSFSVLCSQLDPSFTLWSLALVQPSVLQTRVEYWLMKKKKCFNIFPCYSPFSSPPPPFTNVNMETMHVLLFNAALIKSCWCVPVNL